MKENSILKTKLQLKQKKPLRLKGNIEESLQFNEQARKKMVGFKKPKRSKQQLKIFGQNKKKKIAQIYDKVNSYQNEISEKGSSDLQIIRQLQQNQSYQELTTPNLAKSKSKCLKVQRISSNSSKKIQSKADLNASSATIKSKKSIFSLQKNNQLLSRIEQKKEELQKGSYQFTEHKLKLKELNKSVPQKMFEVIHKEQHVDLSNKKLTHQLFMEIADHLMLNHHLKVLDLSYNLLENKSCESIVQILDQRPLKYLSLRWNKINAEGIVPLFACLTDNSTLLSLDVSYNFFTTEKPFFVQSLQNLLIQNDTLRHLNLQYCRISQKDCKAIQRLVNLKSVGLHGLHIAGNYMYFVNKFGFVQSKKRPTQLKINYAANMHFREYSASKKQNFKKCDFSNNKRTASLHREGNLQVQACSKIEDRCWQCEGWSSMSFSFTYTILSAPFQNIDERICFIHLSCYDYQPLIMQNSSCIDRYSMNGEFTKLIKHIDFTKQLVFKVNVAVPSYEEITFFFSTQGEIHLNDEEIKIKYGEQINFSYNRFFDSSINDDGFDDKNKYKVFLREVNIRNPKKDVFKQENRKSKLTLVSMEMSRKSQDRSKSLKTKAFSNDKKQSIDKNNDKGRAKKSISNASNTLPRIKSKIQFNKEILINDFQPRKLELHYPAKISQLIKKLTFSQDTKLLEQITQTHECLKKFQLQHFFAFEKKSVFQSFLFYSHFFKNEKFFIDCIDLLNRKEIAYEIILNDIAKYMLGYIPTENEVYQKKDLYCSRRKRTSITAFQQSRQKKGKEVKFEQQNSPLSKNSIDLKLEKSEPKLSKKLSTAKQVMHEQHIIRHAMTMKCLHDKFSFNKKEIVLLSTLLNTNFNSSNKSSKSLTNIPRPFMNPFLQRVFLMEFKPTNSQFEDLIISQYTLLLNQYVLQKGVLKALFEDISKTKEMFKENKLKEINQIILTHNYYYTCLNYDKFLTQIINEEFIKLQKLADIAKYITANSSSQLNLQQSATQAVHNLLQFLGDDSIQSKQLKTKSQGLRNLLNSQKKRIGKWGQQMSEIKQQLRKYNLGLTLPQNSWKFKIIAQQQIQVSLYNRMVMKLNIISEIFIKVIQKVLSTIETTTRRKNKENYKWINNLVVNNLSVFISKVIKNQNFTTMKKEEAKLKSLQILQSFFMYGFSELVKLLITLHHSSFQERKLHTNQERFIGYDALLELSRLKILKAICKLKQANHKPRSSNKPKTIAQLQGNRQLYELRNNQNQSSKQVENIINPFIQQTHHQTGYNRKTNSTVICRAFKIVLLMMGQIWKSSESKDMKEEGYIAKDKEQKQSPLIIKKCQTSKAIDQQDIF